MHVLTRTGYARDDAVTPLKIALGMVAVNLALNLTLVWPLGAAGLAWSTAISATLQVALLAWMLRRHADVFVGEVWAGLGRSAVATVLMAAALALAVYFNPPGDLNWLGSLALLGVLVSLGVGVYATVTLAMRSPEWGWLRRG